MGYIIIKAKNKNGEIFTHRYSTGGLTHKQLLETFHKGKPFYATNKREYQKYGRAGKIISARIVREKLREKKGIRAGYIGSADWVKREIGGF